MAKAKRRPDHIVRSAFCWRACSLRDLAELAEIAVVGLAVLAVVDGVLAGVQAGDVVVGISAAGRAPFVLGALKRAREIGATPIGVTCNPDSLFVPLCDVTIAPYVGPEVISGSTRLKAGTAQKLVLNMLSTGAMIRTGKVYSNLMINVKPTNEKLWERATRIIMQIADIDHDRAGELLKKHGSIRGALEELGIM